MPRPVVLTPAPPRTITVALGIALAAVLGYALALVLAFVSSGCGANVPLVPIDDGNNPPAAACTAHDVRVVPADGAGPLHRMTEIQASWQGYTDAAVFAVTADDGVLGRPGLNPLHGAVIGETFVDVDAHRAIFLPHGALPADAHVAWSLATCNDVVAGAFDTGALLHPHAGLDGLVGTGFDLDLRRAGLVEPQPTSPAAGVPLKWRVAPTMLFAIEHAKSDVATVVLVPGMLDEHGATTADFSLPLLRQSVDLRDNPYLTVDTNAFAVRLPTGQRAMLHDLRLVVGLENDKTLSDGHLSAVVDLRRSVPLDLSFGTGYDDMEPLFSQGVVDACETLAVYGESRCFPCDETDKRGRCFALELEHVTGLPTDEPLYEPSIADGFFSRPCANGLCAPDGSILRPIAFPAFELRVPCPEGQCPPRAPPRPSPSPLPR